MKVMIIGTGWAGASAHYLLKKLNINSELFESRNVVGGHSRSEKINGVIYEPNGPHIFHTSNKLVNDFVNEFGLQNIGSARFQETGESGNPTFAAPKEGTLGKLQAGFLEKSNPSFDLELPAIFI